MSDKVMSMSNPSFDDLGVVPGTHSPTTPKLRSSSLKVSKPILLGLGCAVAAIAFAGGYFAGGASSSSTDSDAGAGDPDAALEATLAEIVENNLGLQQLNASDVSEIVEAYLAAPADFDDAFIPKEFAALMSEAALEEGFEPSRRRRRLSASVPSFDAYRSLTDASPLAQAAYEHIQSGNYPDPVTTRDDVATVYKEGSRCYIVVKETDSFEDWINNIDLGKEDVMSVNKSTQRNKSCGCEKKTWWWCSRYKQCAVNTVLGSSFDGFGKAWNEMRAGIYSRIQSKCGGVSDYVFTGYSRGGGIVAVGAFGLWKEGLIPASKMKLVTFGCPRALTSGSSDDVHGKFLVERHVYKNDPVPTLPANWWGFKHFGEHICEGCRKIGRNRPYVTNLFSIGDHTNYDNWI